jgi:two-component system cell cycle response regulator
MSVKLLAIDDCKIIRQTVVHALRNYNCTVLEACDGVAGLAVARRERPDAILLDYKMPVMDGCETLVRLRADAELRSTPVIMLTAESSRAAVVKIAKLGVRDYLLKPFDGAVLIEKLGRLVALKTQAESQIKPKRVDDPIHILVVDDKPAIAEQIRAGLSDTPWKVTGSGDAGRAAGLCLEQEVDVVLASLTLPNEGAHTLFQNLRGYAATAAIPVLGLCVKTAVGDQTRFQAAGFRGIITKPIDCAELKTKVCRALKLETSYKYFQQRDGTLVLTLPKDFHPGVAQDVISGLGDQLTATVNAGGDKLIVDLTSVASATLPVIELLLSTVRACGELSLRHAMVGSETMRKECLGYEEAAAWLFARDFEQAVGLLK